MKMDTQELSGSGDSLLIKMIEEDTDQTNHCVSFRSNIYTFVHTYIQ